MIVPIMYALTTSIGVILGGLLSFYSPIRLVERRYLVAFAGGSMVAVALFDLIPGMQRHNAWGLFLGFFFIYILDKLAIIHACGKLEHDGHTGGWGALFGIASERLIEGIAIAVGFATDPGLGLLISLALFVHELPSGIATSVILQQAGFNRPKSWLALLIDAGLTPLGVLLSIWIPAAAIEPLIGFTAGVFLYVGASDLLPNAHQNFNRSVVFATLAGGALIPALGMVFGLI